MCLELGSILCVIDWEIRVSFSAVSQADVVSNVVDVDGLTSLFEVVLLRYH